jgi:hypothetical protein
VRTTIGWSPDSLDTHTEAVTFLPSFSASHMAPVSAHNPPPPHSGSKKTLVSTVPSSVYIAAEMPSAPGNLVSSSWRAADTR